MFFEIVALDVISEIPESLEEVVTMDDADQQTTNDVSHDAAEVSVDKGENDPKQLSPDESPAKPDNPQVVALA